MSYPARQVRRQRQAERAARQSVRKAPKCPSCGKRGFRSEHAAVHAIIGGRSGHRVYLCESGMWHTTSKRAWR